MGYNSQTSEFNYYELVIKHIDRMSDDLIKELNERGLNPKLLIGYYILILHLESLLLPFHDDEFYKARRGVVDKIPSLVYAHATIDKQFQYFQAISDLFQLLLAVAYNKGVLKIKITKEYNPNVDLF